MKTTLFLAAKPLHYALLLLTGYLCLFLSSCDKDDKVSNDEIVAFTAYVTKPQEISGTENYTWSANATIGVFLLNPGGTLPYDVIEDGKNREYKATGDSPANMIPVTDNETIRWPQAGAADFVAYYPWKEMQSGGIDVTDYTYPIDITGQDAAGFDPDAIDVLYAKVNGRRMGQNVPFAFNRVLGKLCIHLQKGTGADDMTEEDFSNITITAHEIPSSARLNLSDGTLIEKKSADVVSIVKKATATGVDATFESIVIPFNTADYPTREMVISNGHFTIYWKMPNDISIKAGKTTIVTLKINGAEIEQDNINIVPWTGTEKAPSTGNAGDTNPAKIEMVKIKAGTFTMGDTDVYGEYNNESSKYDITPHQVTLTHDFYMSKYEVTNAQYCKFLNNYAHTVLEIESTKFAQAKPGSQIVCLGETVNLGEKPLVESSAQTIQYVDDKWVPVEGYENHPIDFVYWHGALAFCQWAGGRLPTEAEWEYASRAGGTGSYSMGAGGVQVTETNLEDYEWFNANSGLISHTIGAKLPNAWEAYDMNGNVSEWCYDWYNENFYTSDATVDPVNIIAASKRVARGGYLSKQSLFCRPAYRFSCDIDVAPAKLGFRVVFPTN